MCGLTRMEDAKAAIDAGVDALGFIFFRKSPRYIDPERAKAIINQLPPFVDVVGVFVDKKRSEVEEIIQYCGLGYAQLHGNESPKYCERLGWHAAPCQVLKVFRVSAELKEDMIEPYNECVKGFLLDTYVKENFGGTGKCFDWSLIKTLNLKKPFMLAGGLTVENIGQAIELAHPYGVDINSGVEKVPGIKDHQKIREIVQAIRGLSS